MPSLFLRNGVHYIISSEKGKRVWRSLRTRDEAEARQLFQEFERERLRKTRTTVSAFFEDFLDRAPLNFRLKTVTMYAQSFRNFLRMCKNKSLNKVTPLDFEAFKQRRAKEVSPVSVNIELRTLRAAFNEAKRLRLIEENPTEGIRPVRVPYKEASYLSESEFHRLLSVVDDSEFSKLIKFAVLTMMRLGEITNLRWKNVHLPRREIHVSSNGEFRVKGGRPRTIPMNSCVYDLLSARVQMAECVFTNCRGQPLNGRAVSRRFKRYVRKAGLDDRIHFHSLRHTGISWLINRGVPPAFVQRIAGHSSLVVTQIYSHVEDKNLVTAIRAFGKIMAN